jgi:hypothetical protein
LPILSLTKPSISSETQPSPVEGYTLSRKASAAKQAQGDGEFGENHPQGNKVPYVTRYFCHLMLPYRPTPTFHKKHRKSQQVDTESPYFHARHHAKKGRNRHGKAIQ